MYWLVISTLFWGSVFGNYPSAKECQDAAKHVQWYETGVCIPQPAPPVAKPNG